MIVVNPSTRQFNIPGADLVFGVTADSGSERKYFQCPRIVGNNLDLAGSFIRMNYRNANGEIDEYLVEDVAVDGDNVTFSWKLSPKVTMYKGNVTFVMCVVGPDTKVKWHTTLGRGQVLEGLEPDNAIVEEGTADVVAQLIAMVEAQTEAVEAEGTKQIKAVQSAAKTAETASVAEIEAKGVNVRESIPDDYTALSEVVDGLVRGRAGAIVCEAAGSAVMVSDASDLPIQGLRIFGKSTQDGTPTPDAPVEIVSVDKPVVLVGGKNLLKKEAVTKILNGVTFTVNEDGSVLVSGTATANTHFPVNASLTLSKGDYVLTGCPSGGGHGAYRIYYSDNTTVTYSDYGQSHSFSLDDTYTGIVIIQVFAGATVENATFYPMVRVASVGDNTYESGSSRTVELTHTLPGIPVASGGNYTDADGQQWICDEVDLERGVYVQRIGKVVFDGSQAWGAYGSSDGNDRRFRSNAITATVKGIANANSVAQIVCSALPTISGNNSYSMNEGISLETNKYLSVYATDYAGDVHAWSLYLESNPMTVIYALATPIETPLSETEIAAYRALHSNYPNTTILNDSGAHMVVKYAADTKLYIDNKISALIGG